VRALRTAIPAAVACLACATACSREAEAQRPAAASSAPPSATVDARRLVGRWLRPDGDYVLEIAAAQEGGVLDARYFNPQPKHVGRAAWRREGEKLLVTVVLQDVNYPGSTYELVYLADADRLGGDYYQPALQQHFDVEFVRWKE
jgi:hypothetical protein